MSGSPPGGRAADRRVLAVSWIKKIQKQIVTENKSERIMEYLVGKKSKEKTCHNCPNFFSNFGEKSHGGGRGSANAGPRDVNGWSLSGEAAVLHRHPLRRSTTQQVAAASNRGAALRHTISICQEIFLGAAIAPLTRRIIGQHDSAWKRPSSCCSPSGRPACKLRQNGLRPGSLPLSYSKSCTGYSAWPGPRTGSGSSRRDSATAGTTAAALKHGADD